MAAVSCSAATTSANTDNTGGGPVVLFQDNFDSYAVTNYWVPPTSSGWDKSWGSTNWDILDNAGDHYAGYNALSSSGYLMFTNRQFTNFVFSATVRPAPNGIISSLIGRSSGGNSYQLRFLGQTNIQLYKVYNGGAQNAVLTNVTFAYTNTTYQAILGILATNVSQITVVVSNASTSLTINYTDDGATYGVVPAAGKIGVFVSYNGANLQAFTLNNVYVTE